ncbi:long-chain fatty acid--CoA ligase [Actinomadura logoneensis]|uniref:Long-chain fatty acid--CoA ligase n=1 Tax=Actinomadura logoneensis TaxID=2293572 RepID=A0A372JBC6_9ACTN|nr:class I adenylate-forming enzyme family protein [Actinomadura logoneensis]RFU37311.1 long-chain fatty acid--CoA ligase [Actinomadura logoneensis]
MPEPQLDAIVREACVRFANRTALRQGAERLTYADLGGAVARLATAVDRALADAGPDRDRVAVYARNSIDYVLSYLALLSTGRVPFLVDVAFGQTELEAIRTGCGVTAFLADAPAAGDFPLGGTVTPVEGSRHALVTVPASGEPAALLPDTAVCRFTSGTTGVPKCLEFSGSAVLSAARNWVAGTGLDGGDRTLCLAAFTNGLAFNTSLLSSLLVGAEIVLHTGPPTSARIARTLADTGATRMVAFPLVYRTLAGSELCADRLGGLHLAISAGAELPAAVRARFEQRFGVRIADYYGVAEAGPCTFERDPDYRRGLGTPLPGVTLRPRRRPDGATEILLRTASMASRYLNAPGELERRLDADGFYATGDLGHLADGRLFVTGRVAGVINLAGRKIDPHEVEGVVRAIDGVRDAVLFADADADGQTVLHMAVAGDRPLARADVLAGCRGRLAAYKVPQRISFLPEIPRSSAGKVRLNDLRAAVAATASGRESTR